MNTQTLSWATAGLVFLGAGVEGVARYIVGMGVQALAGESANASLRGFPMGTLFVNVSGCLVMGLLLGWWGLIGATSGSPVREEWRVLILVGVLGGYTTFSSFGREFLELLRGGDIARAVLYVALSVVLSLLAVWAGHLLGAKLRG